LLGRQPWLRWPWSGCAGAPAANPGHVELQPRNVSARHGNSPGPRDFTDVRSHLLPANREASPVVHLRVARNLACVQPHLRARELQGVPEDMENCPAWSTIVSDRPDSAPGK